MIGVWESDCTNHTPPDGGAVVVGVPVAVTRIAAVGVAATTAATAKGATATVVVVLAVAVAMAVAAAVVLVMVTLVVEVVVMVVVAVAGGGAIMIHNKNTSDPRKKWQLASAQVAARRSPNMCGTLKGIPYRPRRIVSWVEATILNTALAKKMLFSSDVHVQCSYRNNTRSSWSTP